MNICHSTIKNIEMIAGSKDCSLKLWVACIEPLGKAAWDSDCFMKGLYCWKLPHLKHLRLYIHCDDGAQQRTRYLDGKLPTNRYIHEYGTRPSRMHGKS